LKRRNKQDDALEDDGRTIVSMNVEGMPGYRRDLDSPAVVRTPEHEQKKEQLSPRETRMIIFASMKWAFLFSAGFALILVLFIIFCVKVWFA